LSTWGRARSIDTDAQPAQSCWLMFALGSPALKRLVPQFQRLNVLFMYRALAGNAST
jgi:hypothetical protein